MSSFELALVIGATFFSVIGYFWWRGTLNVVRAQERVHDVALLIDADRPDEFAADHLDGAVNIPAEELAQRASDVGPFDRPIVVYARHGVRSAQAAHALRSVGYRSVTNVGPMRRWTA